MVKNSDKLKVCLTIATFGIVLGLVGYILLVEKLNDVPTTASTGAGDVLLNEINHQRTINAIRLNGYSHTQAEEIITYGKYRTADN